MYIIIMVYTPTTLEASCRKVIIRHTGIGEELPLGFFYVKEWMNELFDNAVYKFHYSVRNTILECLMNGKASRVRVSQQLIFNEMITVENMFSLDVRICQDLTRAKNVPKSWKRITDCPFDITLTKPDGWTLKTFDLNTQVFSMGEHMK